MTRSPSPSSRPKSPEQPFDSVIHHEERLATLREESHLQELERLAQEEVRHREELKRDLKAREEEANRLELANLATNPDAREAIMDKIRAMRNEKPPEIVPMGRTPSMQAQFELEQAAGRAAVAKAEAEMAHNRELAAKVKAQEEARQAQLTPVYHPNPRQNEVFPASKATLK